MNWKALTATTLSTVSLLGIAPIFYSLKSESAVAQNINVSTNTKFQTFVAKKLYSIAYPQGWFLTKSDRDFTYIFITNRKIPSTGGDGFPDYLVKTDLTILDEKFPAALNRTASSPSYDGEKLVKRANIKIDGKNAVRLWFTGIEGETLITLLPYKQSKTAYIATFYAKTNSKITPTIERIHSSFKSLN